MRKKEVAIDLRFSRRESGLHQSDLAHLLNITQSRVSRLEKGKSVLTVRELCALATIYDKSLNQLLQLTMKTCRAELSKLVGTMNGSILGSNIHPEQRQKSLSELAECLHQDNFNAYDD